MRCLLLPCPDTTSLNIVIRCASIAVEAVRAGHAAAVAAPRKLIDRFASLGFECLDFPEAPFIDRVNAEAPPIKRFGDYAQLIGLNDPAFLADSLANEADAIARFRPDVIYSDISLTAPLSARRHGRPLASLCNLSWTPPFWLDEAEFEDKPEQVTEINRLLAERGLPPVRDLSELIFARSDLKLVPSCPEFEAFPRRIEGLEFVGFLYSDALEPRAPEVEVLKDGAHLLVYMGIGDIDLDLMVRVLPAAFDGTRFNVTVAVGDFYPEVPEATSNVRFVRFLPLRATLARTDLAIFHGGSGLVMTCLLYGVPGLMFPCGVYEREFHAETMAKVGAGVVCYEREQFNPEELRRRTEAILGGDRRAKAAAFGRYLRSLGGPRRAVELLSELAAGAGRRPVYARREA